MFRSASERRRAARASRSNAEGSSKSVYRKPSYGAPADIRERTLYRDMISLVPTEEPPREADEPMLYCPVCSAHLIEQKCKLVCPQCGYFLSCSDYY
jgi:hypothetical protein